MKALLASAAFLGFLAIACQGGEEAPPALTSTPTAAPSPVSGAASATPEAEGKPRLIFLRPEVDAYGDVGVIHMSDDLASSNVVQLTPADVRASFVGLSEDDGTGTLYYMAEGETGNVFTLETRDLASGETTTLASIEPREGVSPSGSLSPDGRYIAISYRDGIDLLDLTTDARRRILTNNLAACEGGALGDCYAYWVGAWSPDGDLLLTRKTFWEGGVAVVVDPFREVPQEIGPSFPPGERVPEIATWSPTGDAWCGYGHYETPSGLYLSEQPEWQLRNLLPEYETYESGAPWRNVADCVWLDEHRIAFVTFTTDPEGGGSEYSTTVSIYDLETAAVTLLADFGTASSPVFWSALFEVPGANALVFNDRKSGQPGLLSATDGARTPILQAGDIVVAVTQPIALPEGIVAAEPEVRPCAPLTVDCEVQVTNVAPDQLNVREGPGQQRVVLGQVSEGEIVCLTGTSVFSEDGFRWWPVRSQAGVKGWVAGGDPQQPERPWLTATGRKCEE
jgi:hypothetical protein